MALFMRKYRKGLKKKGYKVVKRTCYNCGSTGYFIAHCPYEIKDNKYNRARKRARPTTRRAKGTWEKLT